MTRTSTMIFIYNDEGVAESSLHYTQKAFEEEEEGVPSSLIEEIDAKAIIKGTWRDSARCLLIPGGADLSYCKKLNGDGNSKIKEYVWSGGTYIGICAGAYFAAGFVEFDKGGPLEILGPRELKFFPGIVRGPLLSPYFYDSHEGACVAEVSDEEEKHQVYFNGGGDFVDPAIYPNVTTLCTYTNQGAKGLAAIVECKVGRGKAILTGIHPEYTTEFIQENIEKRAEGWKNLRDNVLPKLSDKSHRKVFRKLMAKIEPS